MPSPNRSLRKYRSRDNIKAEYTQIQFRFTGETRTRLEHEAFRRSVSMNLLAENAIKTALDRWEKEKVT